MNSRDILWLYCVLGDSFHRTLSRSNGKPDELCSVQSHIYFQIQSQFCKQNCLLMSVYFHICPKISKEKLWQIAFLKMQSGALWQNGLLEAKTWINVFPVFLYFFCFLTPPYSSGITFHRDVGIKRFTLRCSGRFHGADNFIFSADIGILNMQMIHRKIAETWCNF